MSSNDWALFCENAKLKPPKPTNEGERLQALCAYGILDSAAEQEFDDLTKAASYVCGTPIALVSLVDADRQWFKSKVGLDVEETPRDYAFCAYTILDDKPLVVPNAEVDERFADNPLVTGDPKIRFYAGAPLRTSSGFTLGSLCVIDRVHRELTSEQLEILQGLARQVVTQLELRANLEELKQKQLETQELKSDIDQVNTKLRGVIDHSSNFVGVLGLDGTLLDANRTALAAAGVSFEDVVGKPFWETPWWLHSAELQERLKQAVLAASSGFADDFDATHPTPSGSTIDVEFSLKPVLDETGAVSYLIPEGRDVTERNRRQADLSRLNQDLARSNEELEEFAYVASHDLQEPLRKISSYGELLLEDCGSQLDENGLNYLQIMLNASERLKRLISDLLAFSRINTNNASKTETDAEACLEAAIDSLELTISENDAEVTYDTLPKVMADKSHLILLLQNLVGNGLKYRGDSSPSIHISVRDLGQQYEFSVQDNGIGIEPKFHKRIFEIFQRLHSRSKYSGTGIGLALCKRIVDRFGGNIRVESTPGSGSTFFFTVDKASKVAEKTQASKQKEEKTARV